MRRKRNTVGAEEAHIRLAWWTSFLATVALIAILGLARSAGAMTLPPNGSSVAAIIVATPEEEESEAEEESESAECEASEEEEEEEEEEECEADAEGGADAPRECVLSSASATVSTATHTNKVRLAIRYTAYAPGAIQVVYWLRGTKGPLSLGTDHSQLGKQGVIRKTETLSAAQMTRALAAKDFTIQLRPANAPARCHSLLDRHLTVRHNTSGRLTWSDPGPAFTAARQG
jgi:ribosomal protein L12E/L44/L45/RPP1/RPP2